VTTEAEPAHIKRLRVVVMVGDDINALANLAGLANQFPGSPGDCDKLNGAAAERAVSGLLLSGIFALDCKEAHRRAIQAPVAPGGLTANPACAFSHAALVAQVAT
jgi:hypothetical protein